MRMMPTAVAGPPQRNHRDRDRCTRVINERRAHVERLSYLSRFDDLTGELNRRSLTEMLEGALADAAKLDAQGLPGTAIVKEIESLAAQYGKDTRYPYVPVN